MSNQNKTAGTHSERMMAMFLGADATVASGAVKSDPGDLRIDWTNPKIRGEHKSTTSRSLALKLDWLTKICEQARGTDRMPIFTLSFTDGRGCSEGNRDWVAMRKADWLEMMQRIAELEEEVLLVSK